MARIADISHYQGKVDWAMAAKELLFCLLRASCGVNVDKKYRDNVDGCEKYGVPYHAYHYLKATDCEAAYGEAEVFAEAIRGTSPLYFVVDCEYSGITAVEKKKAGSADAIVDSFVFALKRLLGQDIRVAVYIGHHLYNVWRLDYDSFAYVWIPRYGKDSGEPEQPPDYQCDLWQYTSKGTLDGVKGNVDLNKLVGTKPLSFFIGTEAHEQNNEGSCNMTNHELAAFAKKAYADKWVYWYGTCGYKCTTSLYDNKIKQYPSHYTSARASGYKADIAGGRMCADCVGLIKSFFWMGGKIDGANKYLSNHCPDVSANGMYKLCAETGDMSTLPDIPGIIVWKDGHIGVYVGDGYTVELQGFATDCVKRKANAGTWTRWGKLPASMIRYVDAQTASGTYKLGDCLPLSVGTTGADVKELQTTLMKLGYDLGKYGADGDFGVDTKTAVVAFQRRNGVAPTGIFDSETYNALLAVLNPTPVASDTDIPDGGSAPAYVLIIDGDEASLRDIQREYGGKLAEIDSVELR